MFTDSQIATLNAARTILRGQSVPNTFEGGRAAESYERAEHAIFQALNVTRSYLGQPIPDWQMHNRPEAAGADDSGYATSDPKHPEYHSTHADIWDMREGK